jgi:tetratricopeptide (TPR) repeat protein/DNA-binding CsgD family transcriptional regulator
LTEWRGSLAIAALICLLNAGNTIAQDNPTADSLVRVYQAQRNDSNKVKTLDLLFDSYIYNDAARAKRFAVEQLAISRHINYPLGVARGTNNLGVYYSMTDDYDSCRFYYQSALSIYKTLGHSHRVAKVNYGIAIVEYYRGNFDTALAILDTVVQLYRTEMKDSVGLGVAYTLVGSVNMRKGDLQIALRAVLKAVAILEKEKDLIRLADAYSQLGSVESILTNHQKSIGYNMKALTIYQEKNDRFFESQALNDIGNSYFYLAKYPQALEHLEKSVVLSRTMGSVDLEATALTNIGKTYVALRQYDSAASYLQAGLALAEKSGNKVKVVEALNDLGDLFLTMDRVPEAVSLLSRAIPIADSINFKEGLLAAYSKRSESRARLKQYREALEDHRKYAIVNDSMYSESKSRQIEEMRTIFDTEKKEQEIALQQNRIGLLEQTAKVNRLQNLLLILGLVFLVLAGGSGIYALSQKMKRNRLEKEAVDAELAFKQKELTTHALHLAKKNETLENLKQKAKELRGSDQSANGYQQLIRTINSDLQDDRNWENFVRFFEDVHKDFNSNVSWKYPEITAHEIRMMALIRMSLSTKEIASILNISVPGVKKARQRLRKKMQLPTEDSLENAISSI